MARNDTAEHPIARIRARLGLTQAELGALCGVSAQSVTSRSPAASRSHARSRRPWSGSGSPTPPNLAELAPAGPLPVLRGWEPNYSLRPPGDAGQKEAPGRQPRGQVSGPPDQRPNDTG